MFWSLRKEIDFPQRMKFCPEMNSTHWLVKEMLVCIHLGIFLSNKFDDSSHAPSRMSTVLDGVGLSLIKEGMHALLCYIVFIAICFSVALYIFLIFSCQ